MDKKLLNKYLPQKKRIRNDHWWMNKLSKRRVFFSGVEIKKENTRLEDDELLIDARNKQRQRI